MREILRVGTVCEHGEQVLILMSCVSVLAPVARVVTKVKAIRHFSMPILLFYIYHIYLYIILHASYFILNKIFGCMFILRRNLKKNSGIVGNNQKIDLSNIVQF